MEDRLEARISAIEDIQEELEHDIREIKERLVRLISLFKDHVKIEVVHPRGPSPLPNQQVPRPFVQTMSYLPRRTNRPSLRQPTPIAPPTFMATSRPIGQSSDSKGKHCG